MARSEKASRTGRRGFLKGAAAGAAALVAKPPLADAQQAQVQQAQRGITPQPSAVQAARETTPPPHVDVYTTDRPGSDFMAEVIKSLGFEYVAANPGSSFRGLHESLINYGGQQESRAAHLPATKNPPSPWRTATPKSRASRMLVMAHGTVGLQHASMAIYNAFADRVPVYIVLGNISRRHLASQRRGMGAQRAGRRLDGARLHQMGRRAGLAAALRGIGRARLQDRHDAADGPVVIVADACCRKSRCPSRPRSCASRSSPFHAARGRFGRRRRSGQDAGGRRESADRRRTAPRARPQGMQAADRAGRDAAGPVSGQPLPHEFPHPPPLSDRRARQTSPTRM